MALDQGLSGPASRDVESTIESAPAGKAEALFLTQSIGGAPGQRLIG